MQDDNNLCTYPVAMPTMTGGTFMLRSPHGDSMVMYTQLAPTFEIDLSLGGILRGGIHLGVSEVSSTLIFLLKLQLIAFRQMSLLQLWVPRRQVQKSSHPLFFVEPGPKGLDRESVVTCPAPLQRH